MYTRLSSSLKPNSFVRSVLEPARSLSTTQPSQAESSRTETSSQEAKGQDQDKKQNPPPEEKKKKTMAQLDEEMRRKMAAMAGDGGDAGIEYEDGRPADMKRSVRNNMFRYI